MNKEYQVALRIVKRLQDNGYIAYFAGGCVRDIQLNRPFSDIDIATSAKPKEVISLFKRTYNVGISFGVVCVIEEDLTFEIATFREEREYLDGRHPETILYTDNPKLDAIRRDFTINAMFYDPIEDKLHDFSDGLGDIKRGIIKTVGSPNERFSEDYLRILRAIRFSVRFNFELDKETEESIAHFATSLSKLSFERIRDEFNKILLGPNPSKAFRIFYKLGILKAIFPELHDLVGVKQSEIYHPEGDVFEHTMLMLDHISKPNALLGWAILLHDIGKPSTTEIGEDGRIHSYQHEEYGAKMTEDILKRFRFSNKQNKEITQAVRFHMKYAHIDKMRAKKWRKIIADDNFILELELHRIDCISSNGKLDNYVLLLDRYKELQNEPIIPEPIIFGKDLMDLGFKPSRLFKKILNTISDMQLENSSLTKEEAIDYIKSNF